MCQGLCCCDSLLGVIGQEPVEQLKAILRQFGDWETLPYVSTVWIFGKSDLVQNRDIELICYEFQKFICESIPFPLLEACCSPARFAH